jgi:Cu/Zn superoxide dismutase
VLVGALCCSGRVELPGGGAAGGTHASPASKGGQGGDAGTGARAGVSNAGSGGAGSGNAGAGGVTSTGGAGTAVAGQAAGGEQTIEADAKLMPTSGNALVGAVHFSAQGERVDMTLTLSACPVGPHAVHLHANAACNDNGNAAGGHWSPQGEVLADIVCGADGAAQLAYMSEPGSWSIGGPAASDLLRHAIIVHAGSTQDPGARIACGIPAKVN